MKILYILFLLFLIAGCKKKDQDQDLVQVTSSDVSTAQSFRILEQATYGPTEDDMNEVQSLGLAQWIEKQLNSSSAYDSSTDSHQSHLQKYKAIAKMSEPSTYESDSDFNNNFHNKY